MTLLSAAKLLLALGCLDEPIKQDFQVCPLKDGPFGVQQYCLPETPEQLRKKADAMEFNQKREKECPKAVAEFKKAVGGGK